MTDPLDSRSGRGRPGKLYRRLFYSHLTVAGIGLATLGVVFFLTMVLRRAALRTTQLRAPTAQSSLRAFGGVQRSLAATRGWISLGDPEFKAERAAAWANEIEPALAELARLSVQWTNNENRRRLEQVMLQLEKLRKTQGWIEDIARTPGNEPARVLHDQRIHPIAETIETALNATIEVEKERESGHERIVLLRTLADLRYCFTQSRTMLSRIVDSGRAEDIQAFHRSRAIAKSSLEKILADPKILDHQQTDLVSLIHDRWQTYETLADEAVSLRTMPDSNVAIHWLKDKAVPTAREATRLLAVMSQNQDELMRQDAREMAVISNLSLAAPVALMGAMIVGTWYLSRKSAAVFAEPISILSQGTQRLAAGSLNEDLPVTTEDELGELIGAFNTMRGRLEHRTRDLAKSNAALEQLEYRLRSIVESAPTAMVMIDGAGEVVLVNAETEKLFGYARDELLGQAVEVLVPQRFRPEHPDHRNRFFTAPIARRMGDGRDLFGLRADGSEFPIEIGLNPVETDEGLFVLSAIVDISERKRSESIMQQANASLQQSNQELQQFAYVASHDLQEPLRKISSYCQLLKEEQGERLDQEGKEYLDIAIHGAERLRTLVQDLLTFSRISTRGTPLAPMSANACLQIAISNLEFSIEENNAQVTFDALPTVMADESQLIHLFQNLLSNAIKYRGEEAPEIHVGGCRRGEEFEFLVRDNGIGIEAEFHEKIFGIFQRLHNRREYGGTGIGLALCKRIVERFGGRIWVESVPGAGSTFYFTMKFVGQEEGDKAGCRELASAGASL